MMQVRTPKIRRPSVWPPPRSLATTCGISVDVFSCPYLDVSVQAGPPACLLIQHAVTASSSAGFPHSDISGSMRMCRSPELIAACRVLLRLLMPRHSPGALISLTISGSQKNYAGHRRINRSNCSCYPIIPQLSFRAFFKTLPSVALLLSSSFSIVQFSRCRQREHLRAL